MGTLWLCLSGVKEQVKDRNFQIEHLPSAKSPSQFLLLWAIATWLILSIPYVAVAQGEPRQESEGVSSTSARPQDTELSGAERSRAVTQGPPTYGKAEKTGLSYAGTPAPRNILLLGFSSGSSYDDNIFGNNQNRVGDVDFLFGPSLNLHRDGRLLSLALSYQPYFRIYRKASISNAVDQMLGLDVTYQATSRFSLRGRGSAYYTTGLFQPSQNAEFVPTLGSPSSLNNTFYTPVTRQLTWSPRIDASYQARAHDSIGLFAGDSRLNFTQQVSSAGYLQNTEERQAGLLYEHRLSPHTTFGTNYLSRIFVSASTHELSYTAPSFPMHSKSLAA